MSLKFDKARQEMVNKNRKKAGLPVYETKDRPRNAHRYGGLLSDTEIAVQQNDDEWLEENGKSEFIESSALDYRVITSGTKLELDGWYEYVGQYFYVDSNNNSTKKTKADYESAKTAKLQADAAEAAALAALEQEQAEKEEKENNALTTPLDVVSGRMNVLSDMISSVTAKFNSNRPIYTMYVNFQVRIGGEWVTLVNTTSTNWVENCLVRFRNKITGSGAANTFELDILFKQNDRNIVNIDNLEAKLLSTCDVSNVAGTDFIELTDASLNCKFQYGYGDDTSLRSPWYTGRIMDYDCDLNNGNLKYSITGYGGIYGLKEVRLTTKSEYNPESTTNPIKYIENIFMAEFNNSSSKLNGLYKLKILIDNVEDLENTDPDFKQFTNKNLFEIIKDILAGTAIKSQTDILKSGSSYSPDKQILFSYYLDSAQSDGEECAGTVYIYKVPSCYEEGKEVTAQSNITFNYFGPGVSGSNHIVKSWKPKYSGAALIALATGIKMTTQKFQTMDVNGNIIDVIGMGAARLGTTTDAEGIFNTVQEYSKWSAVTQYCYQASMTTMGIPCEAPITGLMQVNARMVSTQGVGYQHATSGCYMILGKTDDISQSGFYSDFDLVKMTKTTPEKIDEIIKDANEQGDVADRLAQARETLNSAYIGTSHTELRNRTARRIYEQTIEEILGHDVEIELVSPDFQGPLAYNQVYKFE